jgi:transcriptional regulator with GAF, ATPase, and Fis domain
LFLLVKAGGWDRIREQGRMNITKALDNRHITTESPTMLVTSRKRPELRPDGCDRALEDDSRSQNGDITHPRFLIKRALERRCLPDEVVSVREEPCRDALPNVVSENPRMSAIYDLINQLARTSTTVLIEGETGTGKEQVARAIHQASQARSGPMVTVSCAAVPEPLLESELFGHEKGAFTSAVGQRKGRFELAHGGTLFLDEIGDIPRLMQAKLLRVLQERCFERVGGSQCVAVDVRVIAATNRCLREMVRDGTFREDLYYRLNVVNINLPPLRQRPEDIPLLAVHFADKFARPNQPSKRLSPESMTLLLRYGWPGNIRELENAIERACVSSPREIVLPEDLPAEVVGTEKGKAHVCMDWSRPLPVVIAELTDRIERRYLRRALERSHGNLDHCARICGVSPRTLSNKLAKHNIDSEFRV